MTYPIILYSSQPVTPELQPVVSTRTGKSETYFEYKLDKYFRELIVRNHTVKDDRKRFPYQPDYVIRLIQHGQNNILIDLEIDEPYTVSEGNFLPIHTVGRDDTRNQYFLSKGWDVIRFMEEQIAKYPNACCKLISEHLYYRTANSIWKEGFHLIKDLQQLPMCDDHMSYSLYLKKHRQTYLNSLKKIEHTSNAISIIADGIGFNTLITEAKQFYKNLYPDKDFTKSTSLKIFLQELLKYTCNFDQIDETNCNTPLILGQRFS